MPGRGAVVGTAGVAGLFAIVAVAANWSGAVPRAHHTPAVTLLYVGAEDCAPCRAWQQHEKAAFVTTAEFPRIRYREVKSATLFNLLNDENWPEDLRGYRNLLGPGAGVPLWLLVADAQVVHLGMGPSQWSSRVLPELKKLLR